jgi:pyruvate,water dikinase
MRPDAADKRSPVVPLHSERARDPQLTGGKAANLARAAAAGLPVLPGFAYVPDGHPPEYAARLLHTAWRDLAGTPDRPLAVRSSSRYEDTETSSMAGRFRTVLDVRGWPDFTAAVRDVIASATIDTPLRGPADGPTGSRGEQAGTRADGSVDCPVNGSGSRLLNGSGHRPVNSRMSGRMNGDGSGAVSGLVGGHRNGNGHDSGNGSGNGNGNGRSYGRQIHHVSGRSRALSGDGATHVVDGIREDIPKDAVDDRAAHDAMAVLVQPMLHASVGGVMFGADPVTGADHIVVSAVAGAPSALVDGTAQGIRYRLTQRGRLLDAEPAEPPGHRLLGLSRRRRLAELARRTRQLYGGPQDIEFAFDTDDRLWLLQARPITAIAARAPRGARLLGPGPVAETFPGVLQPLEEDLWVAPMAHGLTRALDTLGTTSRRTLRTVPPVVAVDGRVAADLRLLGVVPPAHPRLRIFNPVASGRQAAAAWRVGRLRATLPLLALDLLADVDRELAELPSPVQMSAGEALNAAAWGRRALSSLHAQESLAGVLLAAGATNDDQQDAAPDITLAGEALAVLAEARNAGLDDAEMLTRFPVLLGLFPPSLTAPATLPERTGWTGVPHGIASLPVREALRLRIRWVQEMQAGMIRAVAARLAAARVLDDEHTVARLRWHELTALGDGAAPPTDLAERATRPERAPLPAEFRLADDGRPVPEPHRGTRHSTTRAGQGAGGGTGSGTTWDGRGPRPDQAVLVVAVLDPGLAPLLPGLAGLVAETGSPLSHLAVLAREFHVPTATAVTDAVTRFPVGTTVTVDGGTGEVRTTTPPTPSAPPTTPEPTPASSEAPSPAPARTPATGKGASP